MNGNINAIYNKVGPTDFSDHFSPFDLRDLESDVCRITDHHNGEDDSRVDVERRQVAQKEAPAPPQPVQLDSLRPFHELRGMSHEGQVFRMEQCTNLYFHCIEVINGLIELFQIYFMQILSQQLNLDLDSQNRLHIMKI